MYFTITAYRSKRRNNSPVIPNIYIECKTFAELSANEVYRIAKLRQDVFILEQQSIYVDLDDLDQSSWHFIGISDSENGSLLVAYARLRYQSNKDLYKIERVVCNKSHRGQGIGNLLIEQVLNKSRLLSNKPRLRLSSQLSALAFYENFGFKEEGEIYDDGGIEHIDMSVTL